MRPGRKAMCWSDPGKLRNPLNDLQRLLSALMIYEGDLQTHTCWPQPSLGWLVPFHFGQCSHLVHNGRSLPTCPACMPRLLVVITGPGPRGCVQCPRGGICSPHTARHQLGHVLNMFSQVFFLQRWPCEIWLPSVCWLGQWSPWDHRKHMFAIKCLWDPHGPQMSNKLSFLFYFFFSMGISVCLCQMAFFFLLMPFFWLFLGRVLKGLDVFFQLCVKENLEPLMGTRMTTTKKKGNRKKKKKFFLHLGDGSYLVDKSLWPSWIHELLGTDRRHVRRGYGNKFFDSS